MYYYIYTVKLKHYRTDVYFGQFVLYFGQSKKVHLFAYNLNFYYTNDGGLNFWTFFDYHGLI